MNIVINILAVVGFIILLSYLISYIYYYFKHRAEQVKMSEVNPPYQYMQQTGIKCPDYWVNTGVDEKGNYICKNMFNLDVHRSTTQTTDGMCKNINCYSDGTGKDKTVTFSGLGPKKTWEPNNPNGMTSYDDKEKYSFVNAAGTGTTSRCDWINCCGPKDNMKGVWQGVQSTCSYNPNTTPM
jgi:hypothetical protein